MVKPRAGPVHLASHVRRSYLGRPLSTEQRYSRPNQLTTDRCCRSIDRKMVEGFCELADVPVVGLRSPAEWWNTSVCDTPGLLMMHVWNQGERVPHACQKP